MLTLILAALLLQPPHKAATPPPPQPVPAKAPAPPAPKPSGSAIDQLSTINTYSTSIGAANAIQWKATPIKFAFKP